jgi:hypothetical protein
MSRHSSNNGASCSHVPFLSDTSTPSAALHHHTPWRVCGALCQAISSIERVRQLTCSARVWLREPTHLKSIFGPCMRKTSITRTITQKGGRSRTRSCIFVRGSRNFLRAWFMQIARSGVPHAGKSGQNSVAHFALKAKVECRPQHLQSKFVHKRQTS